MIQFIAHVWIRITTCFQFLLTFKYLCSGYRNVYFRPRSVHLVFDMRVTSFYFFILIHKSNKFITKFDDTIPRHIVILYNMAYIYMVYFMSSLDSMKNVPIFM